MHGLTSNKWLQEFHAVKGNKGGTLTPDGKDPTAGYGVCFLPDAQVIKVHDNWFAAGLFRETVTALKVQFSKANIGFWLDTETSIWYCEPAIVFFDKTEALNFAKKHAQIAIWDFAKREEIRL